MGFGWTLWLGKKTVGRILKGWVLVPSPKYCDYLVLSTQTVLRIPHTLFHLTFAALWKGFYCSHLLRRGKWGSERWSNLAHLGCKYCTRTWPQTQGGSQCTIVLFWFHHIQLCSLVVWPWKTQFSPLSGSQFPISSVQRLGQLWPPLVVGKVWGWRACCLPVPPKL